jgi:drug/metabolite transporter (DMT)-like permease
MASMMTLMAPVVAVTSTSLQLGEPLAGSDVFGMALIVLGLVVLSWQAIYKHRAALLTSPPD